MNSNEITKTEEIPKTQVVQYSPAAFIAKAIESNAGIEQLEKLMALQERWEKNMAYKSYLEAMTKFQSMCPPIPKNKKVKYKEVSYRFSSLDMMATTIQPALKECGLSYRWEYAEEEGQIACYCIVSHVDGHSEKSRMSAGKDMSGAKNDIQSIGSTRTYLERYTLKSALGLTTTDEDMDGVSGDMKQEFLERIKLYDMTDHIAMKANSITVGEDYRIFLDDIPPEEDVVKFKEMLSRLNVEPERVEAVRAKLWDDFQKLHKGVSKQWLEQTSKAKIFNKQKEGSNE